MGTKQERKGTTLMNYYERHIGDYLKDTSHLSLLEHGIYTRLLDVYYTKEVALQASEVARLIGARSKEEKQALEAVLQEFFVLQDGAYTQTRCDREIERYQAKASRNREVGKLGGRPRKKETIVVTEQEPTNNHGGYFSEPTNNPPQSPVTSNQTPVIPSVTNVTGDKSPLSPDEIIFGYGLPLLTNAGTAEKQARSFLGGLRKQNGDAALIDALRECLKAKPMQPLEWLAAALPPEKKSKVAGKHAGFNNLNYREGIEEDGTLA